MLLIILPTYVLLFAVVWKYVIKNDQSEHDPDHSYGTLGEILMWGLPAIISIALSIVTFFYTFKLNPYKPIESDVKAIEVQVVAIDWKWLFIYPEAGIATLNYLQIPEKTPVHLSLTADHSPMNSFFIPQLSGQIYAMTGMRTQLNLMADGVGVYEGRAIEINGEGYADMNFKVVSSTQKEFEDWIAQVKKSSLHLTDNVYSELTKPEVNSSVLLYADVEKDLFDNIIKKYMYPTTPVLWKTSSTAN
jgi:cytochrome o ubiquinol oxidase subunit 2